ncbi:MAG: type II CAAX endopeptidase family protein [Chloroflexota bacterium]
MSKTNQHFSKIKEENMSPPSKYKTDQWQPRNLIWFFLIAFGWTWFWWWVLFLSGWVTVPDSIGSRETELGGGAGPMIILLVALSPFGPTIASFVLTAIHEGKTGVKALWKRFWNLNINWKWLLVILFLWPSLRLITNLIGQVISGETYPLLANPDQFWIFIPGLIISTFINGGMSEEFGWRGYALPRLQAKFNALTASLILGVIEGLWHYPLIIIGTWWQDSLIELIYWFVITVILRTWIYNNTSGNLLAMMLFHGMGNVQSDIVWCCGAREHIYFVYGAVALIVVLIFGPKTLARFTKEGINQSDDHLGRFVDQQGEKIC